jgi:serine/threonine protein kinase
VPNDLLSRHVFYSRPGSKGYVHRDIKPENVLFTSDGHCKMVCPASCFCTSSIAYAFSFCFSLTVSRRPRLTLAFRRQMLIAL